jgi:formate--tetrahydrofolate ligase
MFYGNELDLDPDAITWPRTLDMNDRARSTITVSVRGPDKKLRSSPFHPTEPCQ